MSSSTDKGQGKGEQGDKGEKGGKGGKGGKKGKPSLFLTKNFAPQWNEIIQEGKLTFGSLPLSLTGQYLRNGPNPQYDLVGQPYHWFDGDGMLHGLKITEGKAFTYNNKFVQTERLKLDKARGYGYGEFGNVLVGNFKPTLESRDNVEIGLFKGRANTHVMFYHDKVMALMEADLPYQISAPSLETIGRLYKGKLNHRFTAHPKVDMATNEMICFGLDTNSDKAPPYLHYSVFKNGALVHTMPILTYRGPTFMHDIAITEHYTIFFEFSVVMSPAGWDWRPDRKTRFGVLPRNAKTEDSIRWFEFEPCMAFHCANSWERSATQIVVYLCSTDFFSFNNGQSKPVYLTEFVLDLTSGATTKRTCLPVECEFPVVPLNLVGYKTKFIYYIRIVPPAPGMIDALIKYDTETHEHWIHKFADGMYGGEASFVACPDMDEGEDAGVLMTYTHNEASGNSEFYVVNAKTMACQARAVLPQRVPYGFHGTWVTQEELSRQSLSSHV